MYLLAPVRAPLESPGGIESLSTRPALIPKGRYAVGGSILYARTVCPATAEAAVKFKVFLLRRRGQRLPWRDVQNGPRCVGDLISHSIDVSGERYQVLTLRPVDPMATSPIPELYEPVLLGFAPLAFRLRGFERAAGPEGDFAVVQEWHCEAP